MGYSYLSYVFIIFGIVFVVGCSQNAVNEAPLNNTEVVSMRLTSPAFQDNGMIPAKFTCNGANVNPELAIEGVPAGAKSLVLIVDDPDARGWSHWIVFNIAPNAAVIAENSVPQGAIQGTTDFKTAKYGGPCPPSGVHRYMFKLYALDTTLNLGSSATKKDVESAMQGRILSQATVTGLYEQKK